MEKLRFKRYYEYDGALRAYANRTLLLALISSIGFVVSTAFAIYVRLQPPLVIRVDGNGYSTVALNSTLTRSNPPSNNPEPSDLEKTAFIHLFLERYINFSPTSVGRNWADALNMMTKNLRDDAFSKMQKENLIGRIKEDQTTSEFELRAIEPVSGETLTYNAFAVHKVHHLHDGVESINKVVSQFHIRLIEEARTEANPAGLLIAEYWEKPIENEVNSPLKGTTPVMDFNRSVEESK